MNKPSVIAVTAAYARAADTSAAAREALRAADLLSVPRVLATMGRAMSSAHEGAWRDAVESENVLALRALAVTLGGGSRKRGPHTALLESIADTAGAALAFRDLADHHTETGTIPSGATS